MIGIRNLDKYFNRQKPNEIHVIDDLSYEFPKSGMCAIFGPSGCGKTTLLNVIGGLDNANSGEIRYDGVTLTEDPYRIRNRDIGFIFQNYNLNRNETVFDNVADSLRLCGIDDSAVIEERVNAALDNVGMGKFRKRLPDTLSGGQQQRVAIARAIVKNPKVILADEPTGNLDEANTILVMDILKMMSKEHLVILVTHEAKLVDCYCDTVIELSDGRIVGVRENDNTYGYVGRNRNDIYLGELEQSSCGNAGAQLTYYGEPAEKPVKLTLVNRGGRIFLRVDSPDVTVLDAGSEVKLREGVFEERATEAKENSKIDMSKLPAAEGKRYGHLFRLKESIRQGFVANFRNTKGQNKRNSLLVCLFFLGVALVFFTAMFGTELRNVSNTKEQLNRNVFLVYAGDKDIADRIRAASEDPAAAIDYTDTYTLTESQPNLSDTVFYINYASYETFGYADLGYEYPPSVFYYTQTLPISVAGDGKVVAGRGVQQADNEIVITTQLADRIVKSTPYRYVHGYKELIGLCCSSYELDGVRIVGVIRSDENALYCTDNTMMSISNLQSNVIEDANGYYGLKSGECAMIITKRWDESLPEYAVGDTLQYNSVNLTMKQLYDVSLIRKMEYRRPYDAEEEEDPVDPVELAGAIALDEKLMDAFPQITYTYVDTIDGSAKRMWTKSRIFVLNSEDYRKASRSAGMTSLWISEPDEETRGVSQLPSSIYFRFDGYFRLHSTDPAATKRYLEEHFSDIRNPRIQRGEISTGVATPDDRYEEAYSGFRDALIRQLAILAVFFAFMGICMYLVMRASVMNRTREIGIYRAIGAKKSNIVFRFAVETAVVLSLSAFAGYLVISIAVGYFSSRTAFGDSSFYYPLWMAVVLFVFLAVTGIVCGILPVVKLLRKTPSEILAKYDI